MPSRFYQKVVSLSKTPADFKGQQILESSKSSSVDTDPTSTVDTGLQSPMAVHPTSTDDVQSPAPVDTDAASTVAAPLASTVLWQAENGALFPSSRVRHVDRAQDALTHIEESVYNFLWGSKTPDSYKLIEAGYAQISRSARIAKRNAPVVIERLIEKGFVRIERQADVWTRRPTQYRVLGYRAVLDQLDRTGRRWVVKSGNGVLFVQRIEMRQTVAVGSTSTVDVDQRSTVDAAEPRGMQAQSRSTVDAGGTSTFDAVTDHRDTTIDTAKRATSPSAAQIVGATLRQHLTIDDDAVRRIVDACRENLPDTSGEEIAYFAQVVMRKHRANRRIDNWPGFLIKAVAQYFQAPASELAALRAATAAEVLRSRELAQQILDNPESDEREMEWARELLQA
jgi:predicted transcriptional regulator